MYTSTCSRYVLGPLPYLVSNKLKVIDVNFCYLYPRDLKIMIMILWFQVGQVWQIIHYSLENNQYHQFPQQ